MTAVRPIRIGAATGVLALLASLAGCAAGGDQDAGTIHPSADPGTHETTDLPVVPPEAGHVHGMALNPADGLLYLGTHAGTMVIEDGAVSRVGESTVDLMGFTAAGPDHFYASGHPGAADDLPNPVGLLESTDAGQTWRSLSLAGESDFHTLGAAGDQVYGFNGQLVASNDGTDWATASPDVAPVSLAVDPSDARRVVATTEHGPVRSADAGASFDHLADAPLLVFVSWPEADLLWGVGVDGVVYRSTDAGTTWEQRGTTGAAPAAFAAGEAGALAVATDSRIVVSADGGETFEAVASYSGSGH